MDLNKSFEFFNPNQDTARCHILGCGSVGSTVAENLVRCGVTNLTLWDFDKVESKNIVNQMFRDEDIGRLKTEALKDILVSINPDAERSIRLKSEGWKDEMLSGYIFLAVDSIELRKKILTQHMVSPFVKAVFDFRTLLESAQHFAADWSDLKQREKLLKTMNFTDEEAEESTPVSACGMTLGVATTVRLVSALGVDNYINFIKGRPLKRTVLVDGFNFTLQAFE